MPQFDDVCLMGLPVRFVGFVGFVGLTLADLAE